MSLPDQPHRIGYVLKMYPRFSETFIVNEVLAMEELGASLHVFSLRLPVDGRFHERLAQVRAPVTYLPHRLKPRELWDLLRQRRDGLPRLAAELEGLLALPVEDAVAAVELAAQVQQHGLTHLHAHFGSVATDVARMAARLTGIGYSFTAHAKDIFHAEVDHEALRTKLAEARFCVTVSDYNLAHLRERYGAAADGVVRLYNGLDLDLLPYHPPHGRQGVMAVGRLVEKKGFTHLLDAIALLRDRGRVVPLDLVGSGPEEQPLRDQVARLGLADLVTFHGPLPQGRMIEVMRRAAVMAAPCVVGDDGNRDGLPTVLLESLAVGTPAVSTPVTGIPEAIVDDRTGLLVPEGDAAALADALQRVLDDPARARRLADLGRALVEERFDVRRNAASLLDLMTAAAPAVRELQEVGA